MLGARPAAPEQRWGRGEGPVSDLLLSVFSRPQPFATAGPDQGRGHGPTLTRRRQKTFGHFLGIPYFTCLPLPDLIE